MIKSPAFYFYIGLITISVIFVTQALRIPVYDEFLSSGRFLPLVLSFFMVLFSCILAYQQFQSSEKTTHKIEHRFHFFGFLFLVVAYVILIPVFPFSLVTFFFLLASFLFFRTLSFWKTLFLAVILVVVIVFIFQTIFQIVFP